MIISKDKRQFIRAFSSSSERRGVSTRQPGEAWLGAWVVFPYILYLLLAPGAENITEPSQRSPAKVENGEVLATDNEPRQFDISTQQTLYTTHIYTWMKADDGLRGPSSCEVLSFFH